MIIRMCIRSRTLMYVLYNCIMAFLFSHVGRTYLFDEDIELAFSKGIHIFFLNVSTTRFCRQRDNPNQVTIASGQLFVIYANSVRTHLKMSIRKEALCIDELCIYSDKMKPRGRAADEPLLKKKRKSEQKKLHQ